MRIEVHDGDRAEPLVQHAQDREGDRMVPSEGDGSRAGGEQFLEAQLYLGDRSLDVERAHRQITGVGDLARRERRDVEGEVVGAQQSRS